MQENSYNFRSTLKCPQIRGLSATPLIWGPFWFLKIGDSWICYYKNSRFLRKEHCYSLYMKLFQQALCTHHQEVFSVPLSSRIQRKVWFALLNVLYFLSITITVENNLHSVFQYCWYVQFWLLSLISIAHAIGTLGGHEYTLSGHIAKTANVARCHKTCHRTGCISPMVALTALRHRAFG